MGWGGEWRWAVVWGRSAVSDVVVMVGYPIPTVGRIISVASRVVGVAR